MTHQRYKLGLLLILAAILLGLVLFWWPSHGKDVMWLTVIFVAAFLIGHTVVAAIGHPDSMSESKS